jgi:signal transduction histidine kinase
VPLGISAVLGSLYALGALLPFWYLDSPEEGASFFPPAGLTLSVLLLTRRRLWPLWLAVIGITEFVVDTTNGQRVAMAIGFAIANMCEPLVGATCVRWVSARRRASSLRQDLAIYLIFAVVLGPFVGGLIGGTVASVSGATPAWLSIVGTWWLGDAIGVLVVATPILAWSRHSRFETTTSALETAAWVLIAAAVAIVPALLWHYPLLYAVLPVLMLAALRGGWRAASLAGVGVAFAVNWVTVTGHTDELFAVELSQQLVFVQLFLAVTLLAALALAVEVADRRRAEDGVREAHAKRARAERETAVVAEAERRRMARETHDSVGHALNVMLLQSGAARRVITSDPERCAAFLESIENVGREAFRELDMVLDPTDRAPDRTPSRGLANLPSMVDVMRQSGIDVELDMPDDQASQLSKLLDWSAYRIVQEALTNVAKHAPKAHANVTVRRTEDMLHLFVVDDGLGTSTRTANRVGHGLIGMRERAESFGGLIEAGPRPAGGFAVRAHLPLGRPRP